MEAHSLKYSIVRWGTSPGWRTMDYLRSLSTGFRNGGGGGAKEIQRLSEDNRRANIDNKRQNGRTATYEHPQQITLIPATADLLIPHAPCQPPAGLQQTWNTAAFLVFLAKPSRMRPILQQKSRKSLVSPSLRSKERKTHGARIT